MVERRQLRHKLNNRALISPKNPHFSIMKTHISKIYQKLNVNNRRRAVDAARKRNLLPERRRR